MKKIFALVAILSLCVACERNDVTTLSDENENLITQKSILTKKAADSSGIEIIDSVDPKDIVPPRR